MANPLKKIFDSPVVQARILRLQVIVMGLALDFWKDTPFPKKVKKFSKHSLHKTSSSHAPSFFDNENSGTRNIRKPWFADKAQVIEKLWGEGRIFPGDDAYNKSLLEPVTLEKDMEILDLSAGLGGFVRKLVADFEVRATAVEHNKYFASRGMVMSIAAGQTKEVAIDHYNLASFETSKKYGCIFARELFCRVIGKEKFFNAVAYCVKGHGGQISFTDYVLEEKNKENPEIKELMKAEKNLVPLSYIDMVKEWKAMGFDMQIAEDQTDLYKRQILKGLASFVQFLAKNAPSPDTKPLIVHEISVWAMRLAAFENGLRYYRFYGVKR